MVLRGAEQVRTPNCDVIMLFGARALDCAIWYHIGQQVLYISLWDIRQISVLCAIRSHTAQANHADQNTRF